MKITIQQLLCGEKNGAWSLLNSTIPDPIISKNLAFKSDLQDILPSGITWEPALRGFCTHDYFLLIKTYLDNSNDVRKGRVFSHILAIPQSLLDKVSNIQPLLSIFSKTINKNIPIEPITLDLELQVQFRNPIEFSQRFNKVIHGLAELANYNNTIVWVGQEFYEEAVCKYWNLLETKEKKNINFGIYFNISEIPKNKINFIAIPEHIENKFLKNNFCIVEKHENYLLSNDTELYLAGEQSIAERTKHFMETIESIHISKQEIPTLLKGLSTFEQIENINDLKKLVTLNHIVAKYSPDKNKGIQFKNILANKILELGSSANVTEICLLRNIDVRIYNNEKVLENTLNNWLDKYLFCEQENFVDLTQVIKLAFELEKTNWWAKLIKSRLCSYLQQINNEKAGTIWKWIQFDITVFNKYSEKIESTKTSENCFVEKYPSRLLQPQFKKLISYSEQRKWYKLLALSLFENSKSFENTIEKLLEYDINENNLDALELIAHKVKPEEFIKFTVFNGDKRLIKISASICYISPALLNNIDVENIYWQEIWNEFLQKGKVLEDGINDPTYLINKIFDLLVDDKPFCYSLIKIISESEYANLLNYDKRSKLWNKLPKDLESIFLAKTSTALLHTLSRNPSYEVPEDEPLENYILSGNAIGTFLYYNRGKIKYTLPIFIKYTHLPEHILKDYITNYNGNLEFLDSKQLGKLVTERKFYEVAKIIYKRGKTNTDFRIALQECQNLLSPTKQLKIYWAGYLDNLVISEEQWWDGLKETSIKLYGGGPTQNNIWLQAGGDESDLLSKGTGKDIWLNILDKLRSGGCQNVTIELLLEAMIREFPKNENLKILIDLKNKI